MIDSVAYSVLQCLAFFVTHIQTTMVTLLIGLLVFYVTRLYLKVLTLPPGPLPIPFLGNLLLFRGSKVHQTYTLEKIGERYGPVFTMWLGPTPFVFITDLDLAKEAFNKNEFSGRAELVFNQLVVTDKFSDIIFADFGPVWQSLRRVAHMAVRKYSTTARLSHLVRECVDHSLKVILAREGLDRPFMPFDYIYHMFLNIMAASVFGKCYDFDDPEFKKLNYIFHDFFNEHSIRLSLVEFIPIMKYLDRSIVKKREQFMAETREMVKTKYISHYKDFNGSDIRDMCDAIILAKEEALSEGKESAPYLHDDNLSMVLWDLFIGGVDTTHNTFKWMVLLLATNPDLQKRLRQEIESEIGDRIPTHEDKDRCHYSMAFISETIRYRHVVPLGVFHKAMIDSKIGDQSIPKGTAVFLNHFHILNDEKHWSEPNRFIPERFLENGKFLSTRPNAFIPFGVGRRVCLGEKMALIELFLVLANFLHFTNSYEIALEGEPDFEPNPVQSDGIRPKEYRIVFKKK